MQTVYSLLKSLTFLTISILMTMPSCSRNDGNDTDDECPSAVVATWKVDGVSLKSSVYLYSSVGSMLNFTFVGCGDANNEKVIQLSYLPYPPAVGTYPLRDGVSSSGTTAQGAYSPDSNVSYATDTVHTGSITINSINASAKTLSATFQFTGKKYNGSGELVQITEGVITNARYQ